jgi:hypothetical protein
MWNEHLLHYDVLILSMSIRSIRCQPLYQSPVVHHERLVPRTTSYSLLRTGVSNVAPLLSVAGSRGACDINMAHGRILAASSTRIPACCSSIWSPSPAGASTTLRQHPPKDAGGVLWPR